MLEASSLQSGMRHCSYFLSTLYWGLHWYQMPNEASLPGFCAKPTSQSVLLTQSLPDTHKYAFLGTFFSAWAAQRNHPVLKCIDAWVLPLEIPVWLIWGTARTSRFSKSPQEIPMHNSGWEAQEERHGGEGGVEQWFSIWFHYKIT